MRIVDPKGVWFKNNGQYRITDPESKTTFEPQELTKATDTVWVKGPPTMERSAAPLAPEPVEPKPAAPEPKTLAKK